MNPVQTSDVIEVLVIESDPFDHSGEEPRLREPVRADPAFIEALHQVYAQPDTASCWECGAGVGYLLRETPGGGERATWAFLALARDAADPTIPVNLLCEDHVPQLSRTERRAMDERGNSLPRTSGSVSYTTEAAHTAYADVTGAEPMEAGGKRFGPARISVRYDWRAQLGEQGWAITRIAISGPWIDPPHAGTGSGAGVLLHPATAPDWAQRYANANMPTSMLAPGGQGPQS